jgi:LPXTG-motif cell wall-anchored protein
MSYLKSLIVLACVCLISAIWAPGARADEWNKKTILTFNEPVEIPGRVLPAGTYTFQLMDSPSSRNIVQIFDKDGNFIANIIAISDYRFEPTDKTVIEFAERPSNSPEAIQAWFYPGDQYGLEFVYPKSRAQELARANKQPVLAMPNELTANITKPAKFSSEPSVKALKAAKVVAVTPEQTEAAMNTVVKSKPEPARNKLVAQNRPKHLPKTASSTPLVALIGILLLGLAAGFRLLAKRFA